MDYESTPDFDANFLKQIGQILNNSSIDTPKRHKVKHARGSHVIIPLFEEMRFSTMTCAARDFRPLIHLE